MNGFDYYRLKMAWEGETETGGIDKIKTEELVYATSYTEAEKLAYSLIAEEDRSKVSPVSYEIVKTKIDELVYNDILHEDQSLIAGYASGYFEETDDTGVGLYGVKVMFISIDERSGKEKRTHSTLYTPAKSNADASARVTQYLKDSPDRGDFVIRDAKFDATSAIFWPKEYYKSLTDIK